MPRILFLQHDSVFETYGGIQYYLDDLVSLNAEVFGLQNVRALILQRQKELNNQPKSYQADFVPLSSLGWVAKLQNRFPLALYQRARQLISEFKPTVLVNGHVSLGPMVYALHLRTGLPFYTCVYGTDCWDNLWFQDEWCLRRSSRILSISEWTKRILVDWGYDADQIRIIHPRLSNPYESIEPIFLEERGPFTLLTVSRLDAKEKYKGQDHVLEALAKIRVRSPDVEFRYIIQGEGSDRQRLVDLVQRLDLGSCVEFRNRVSNREELEKLYKEADLYVMPSRFGHWDRVWHGEGFGIVYVEAGVCGVPSIAYRCGGATDIIEDGVSGLLVEPDNIDALSDSIVSLIQD